MRAPVLPMPAALLSALLATMPLVFSAAARADDLPKSRAEALAMEARDALPLDAFYDPPSPLPLAAPGTLIRAQPFTGYELPPGAHATRILYHSRTSHGRAVAASGVVLIPAGAPPAAGWPLIAWAHGTNGVARQCAPSLMRDVAYGSEGLMPMVAAGFAVVAADYAGLGTPGLHEYDNKLAQANDVAFSIAAARAGVASLGPRWAAIGHSQGGVAVWGLAELEAGLDDASYGGAISVAGDMDFDLYESHDARTYDAITSLYWPLTAFGIKASFPSFDVARLLTPPFLARYADMTTKGCWYYAYAAAAEVASQPAVRPHWQQIPELRRFNADARSADKPIKGPLLVLAGEDDQSVNFANIEEGVARACKLGLPIEFVHRPGLDHDALLEKTIGLQLAWVRDRLEGKPWEGGTCGR